MTRTRGRAITVALALAAATGISILAATAPAAAYVCAFGIDPPPAASGSTVVNLTGPFVVRQGSADRVLEVTITSGPSGAAPSPVKRTGAAVGPADRYDVPVSGLTRNGTYKALVKASHAGTGIFNCVDSLDRDRRDTERSGEISFGVSVRAQPPTNVQASFDAGSRTAVVTWESSSDPDVAGYKVTRKVGTDAPSTVDAPPEPRRWIDDRLPSGAATITYSVQAARVGPRSDTTSELSGAVAAAPLEVPAPPPPATTTVPAGGTGGTTVGTTVTTAKAGSPAAPGTPPTTRPFVLGRPVSGAPPRAGNAELPTSDLNLPIGEAPGDAGPYRPLLPYPAREELEVEDGEVAVDPAVVGRSEGPGGDGIPQLAFVASGLLSSVVAAHVLWLRKQVAQPEAGGVLPSDPLEPLEPLEPAPSSPLTPVSPPSAPRTAPPDDAPEGVSPFRPVLLVDDLKRNDTRPAAAAAAGRRPLRSPTRADRPTATAPEADIVPPIVVPSGPSGPADRLAGGPPARRPLRAPSRPAGTTEKPAS